jgi:hypothetical protein
MFRNFSIQYLADLLEINERIFHREVKPLILADFKTELKNIKVQNPDLGLDEDYKIYLVDPRNSLNYIETGISIFDYI